MVQYKVKADKADENRQLIEAVFTALKEASPPNLRYASFVQEDGVSFVHIASTETDDGSNPRTPSTPSPKQFGIAAKFRPRRHHWKW